MKAKLCFFDDNYIAARPGTVRRTFSPSKLGEFHDDSASLQLYTSFFYDPFVNKYRLYYEVPIEGKGTEIRMLKLAEGDSADDFITGKVSTVTVEGLDYEHGMHGCAVTFNPDETDPDKRYILIGNAHADDRSKRYFCRCFSKDGKNFSKVVPVYPEQNFPNYKDTYNSIYYNSYLKEYHVTTRCATADRRVALIKSSDGEHWTQPELILQPSSQGSIGVQHYALGVSHIDGIFYGILWRFMTDLCQPDFADMSGYMENDLVYSYDGKCFAPTGLTPICERPLPPEYGCKQLWLLNIEKEKDKYILCGAASRIAHNSSYDERKFAATVFYEIRKDGFCALEGFGKSSTVYTKPILFEGGDITLNFNALAGSLLFAVTDADGKEIEGFGFDDCIGFSKTDSTDAKVMFKNAFTDSLKGRRVRFAIQLDGALLYSVSFEGRPFLYCQPQVSFNDPRPLTEFYKEK